MLARPACALPAEPVIWLIGVAAKLTIAKQTPTEQSAKASKARGLKTPDWGTGLFFIVTD